MLRVSLKLAGVCVFVYAVASGCSTYSAGYPKIGSQYAGYSGGRCPPQTTQHCDSRHAGACRCVSRKALDDFMRTM